VIVDEGEGPVVVLLHGLAGSPDTWRHLAPMLAGRCRVLVPSNAADPRTELDEDGVDRFAIVGDREGADAALELCLQSDRVDALVLLTPTRIAQKSALGALEALEIPVLIFAGEAEERFARIAEELNEAIPSSTLGLVPGVGADLVAEASATLFPMIDEYLRARYLKTPHGHGADGIVTIQLERKPAWVDADGEDDE
jgi:pimeloyl-ACP methyl ester carboxylesterase